MNTRRLIVVALLVVCGGAVTSARQSAVRIEVRAEDRPVEGARVTAGEATATTDADGRAELVLPAGATAITVTKDGFVDVSTTLAVVAGQDASLVVTLGEAPTVEDEVIVVATTRTGRRLEDQLTRVEVLGREEIEEKMLMTPGDIVMMLNEMGGLRVQATSPSIGAASVRVQGMQGRYTRFLSDGLPLFGQQVGGLGLLQIPPMDLGQVEVIKGTASALYGAGAMGGVVNLLSRRPEAEPVREALVNGSTLGATDAVLFLSGPLGGGWSASLLGGGHSQTRQDVDGDGWADVAGYMRGVVRPRLFWDGGDGRSVFVTAGLTHEDREGGTMDGATLPATRESYAEALDTRRYDVGATAQTLWKAQYVVTARGALAWQRHTHEFGATRERDAHDTAFAELAVRGASGRHTWVAGAAYERDRYTPREVPRFAYRYQVPGVFLQDDIDLAPWLSVSASGRVDQHSEYGTFVSPRLAALVRADGWTSRLAVGQGFFAATPLTEETEAAGLTRLTVTRPLGAERGRSASLDLTRALGSGTFTVTGFASRISDPIAVEREPQYVLFNRDEASTNVGVELLATLRGGPFAATSTYTYVRSRETADGGSRDTELTPRHSAGLVGLWEPEGVGRVGVELFYTGRQRLEVNPFRERSASYVVVGLLAERRFGKVRVFANLENLTDVRQTRFNTLVRPRPGADGRWTVDAWAPLDGRVLNAGLHVAF
ncbi:MAG: TonB-dependent receptor [Acidobacteria bacterium]|nr:TonB-dependent receptor [Acidobacteriota bacterium]